MRMAHMVLALGALASAPALAAAGPLQINEFVAGPSRDWDGSGAVSTRDDEWVEVRNAGPTPLDVGRFFLSDGDSVPRYAFSGVIAPGDHYVVFGSESFAWEHAHGWPAFGLSLSNSGDQVLLWQVVGSDTVLVDGYTYRSHEGASDRAVGRLNDDGGWQLYDGLNPYTGTTPPQGNHCDPTPGTLNLCGATVTRPVTWGRVKTLYR